MVAHSCRGDPHGVLHHGPDVGRRRLGRQGGADGLTEVVLFGREGEVHGVVSFVSDPD